MVASLGVGESAAELASKTLELSLLSTELTLQPELILTAENPPRKDRNTDGRQMAVLQRRIIVSPYHTVQLAANHTTWRPFNERRPSDLGGRFL